MKLSEKDIAKIVKLKEKGVKAQDIAPLFNVSVGTITYHTRGIQNSRAIQNKKRNEKIISLYEKGYKIREIVERTQLSQGTIASVIYRNK